MSQNGFFLNYVVVIVDARWLKYFTFVHGCRFLPGGTLAYSKQTII